MQNQIDRITRTQDLGVFRDFSWPHDLPTFCRYNLIYGWNGTGKTTLTRLFRAIEMRQPPLSGRVSVRISGRDVEGDAFGETTIPVRVFNRDFVGESLFTVGGGDFPPIFVVGKENVEKQKEAERLKPLHHRALSSLEAAQKKKRDTEKALDNFCKDGALSVKTTLRSPGSNPYNNFNKNDFHQGIEKLANGADVSPYKLSSTQRDALHKQRTAQPKEKLDELSYELPDLAALSNKVAALLATSIIAVVIDGLKKDPKLSSWVYEGLKLYETREIANCLFCNQPLPSHHLASLQSHFSTEFEALMQGIDQTIASVKDIAKEARELVIPNKAQLYDALASDYEVKSSALCQALDIIQRFLELIVRRLEDKKERPFDLLAIEIEISPVDRGVVNQVNAIVKKHNQITDNFTAQIRSARDSLANDMMYGQICRYIELRDAACAADNAVTTAAAEVKRIHEDIDRLEREVVHHRQPAEELNRDLREYLGHSELQLQIKDTGYLITRNGSPANKTLSEGETTAIALLYFLKSLEDRQFDMAHGVVVLDDPVSSLDQNSIFAAFGYIRARTDTAGQVFVFTHNFLFFRLVREWFKNLRGPLKNEYKIYMVLCSPGVGGRTSSLQVIDPLLMNYESDYHYLFYRMYRMAKDPPPATLEAYYSAPSIARRVMETFLAFRVPDIKGQQRLFSQMKVFDFDNAKKTRIYRFLQTHAHRDAIGGIDEDLTLLMESRSVLQDILDFMMAADKDHVERMVSSVTTTENQPD